MIHTLEIDDAELSSMWETEWKTYASVILGIPENMIADCRMDNGIMVVTEC